MLLSFTLIIMQIPRPQPHDALIWKVSFFFTELTSLLNLYTIKKMSMEILSMKQLYGCSSKSQNSLLALIKHPASYNLRVSEYTSLQNAFDLSGNQRQSENANMDDDGFSKSKFCISSTLQQACISFLVHNEMEKDSLPMTDLTSQDSPNPPADSLIILSVFLVNKKIKKEKQKCLCLWFSYISILVLFLRFYF